MIRYALAALLLSAVAYADPAKDTTSAQFFFDQGREAAERGDHKEACKRFGESLRLQMAVGTLFNLATCEEAQGQLASAWLHLREGIDRLEETDPRHGPAVQSAAQLAPRVPRLRLARREGSVGRILRDGIEVGDGSLDIDIPVNPGTHVIRVEREGHRTLITNVQLAEGERQVVLVKDGEVSAEGSSRNARSPWRTVGWAGLALGGAVTAVGGVTSLLAFSNAQVVHNHCSEQRVCDSEGVRALEAGKNFASIATPTLIAGGAILIGSVVLLLVVGDREVRF